MTPDQPVPERISDERLARLIASYGKMSFERSYAELAGALKELRRLRRGECICIRCGARQEPEVSDGIQF